MLGTYHRSNRLLATLTLLAMFITLSTTIHQIEAEKFELYRIIDPPEPNISGFFGIDIAMTGNRVVIGERGASRAHIYDISGDLIKTLKSPTGDARSLFGWGIAIFGNHIVIGESKAEVNGLSGAGMIHFYDLSGNLEWSRESPQPQKDGGFGFSMSSDGEKLVVGEPGLLGGDENMTSRVHLLDAGGAFIGSFDRPQPGEGSFGWSVGIHRDTLVVGEPYAWHSSGGGYTHGLIHIYSLNGSGRLMSFGSPVGKGFGNFGDSVSVGEDIIAVGEVRADANSTEMAGLAHIYSMNGTLIKTLYPLTPKRYGYFGTIVSVSESYVAVTQRGHVYLYDHAGNLSLTVSEEVLTSAAFGIDVVVDGDRLASGVNCATVGGIQMAGEVHLYELRSSPADIMLSSLHIEKTTVSPGEEVDVTASLENVGELQGNYTVVFALDGVEKGSFTVTLDGGQKATKTIKVSSNLVGVHQVTVGDKSVTLEVVQSGIPGYNYESLLIGIVIIVVILNHRARVK